MVEKMPAVEQVNVFCVGAHGGNPAPIVLNADRLTSDEMREIAAGCGYEAGFVLAPSDIKKADLQYRFFVPLAEMDMCGHGTLGTTWLLAKKGQLKPGEVRVETKSGIVRCRISDTGEVATGFSLYPDALIARLAETEAASDLMFLPLGHDRNAAARLRTIGWRTVAALGKGDDPSALGCTHRLAGQEPVAL